MAAVVQIIGYYGASPGTKQAVTSQRYNTAIPSQRDPGLSYPCNVPPDGETYYSDWMYTGAEIVSGSYSQLTNWRWGTNGNSKTPWGLGAGKRQVALKDVGDPGCPVASYAAPTGISGLSGYNIMDPVNGHPYYKDDAIGCADADLYTSASPLVFDSNVYTPESASHITLLVTHQLVLEDDTTFGEKGELTDFIRWTEI